MLQGASYLPNGSPARTHCSALTAPFYFILFYLGLFTGQIVAQTRGKSQEKPEAAWLADLTNVTVFDNEAFASRSRDFQIAAFKVVLMALIQS